MTKAARCLLATLCLTIAMGAAQKSHAQGPGQEAPGRTAAPPRTSEAASLPADVTTRMGLELSGRTLRFSATAGSIRIKNDRQEPQADVAYVAYQLDSNDRRNRPVLFAFNGGPGSASGWLHVGALGPWRVPLSGDAGVPSASPEPLANADTWLDFTDLVFIDPPGTGYSRIVAPGDDARRRFWSVNGDIDVLAETIRRWLDQHDRITSPKYLLGESYGGFRGPRLARALQSEHGVGVKGIVLVSPLLDTHVEGGFLNPFAWVDRLPSMVATSRAMRRPVKRADLADAEAYAASDYLTDLVRGERDTTAVARLSETVAALTGLDRAVVERYHGRIDTDVFLHELNRTNGRIGSIYDATVTVGDPDPHRNMSAYPDPITEGLSAPVTGAMMAIYSGKLNWRPDGVYHLLNKSVFPQWDWGRSIGRPQSLEALQQTLSVDPRTRVLIAHGLFDLRTPYFTTVRLLNAMSDAGTANRVRLEVYAGGHMFYINDASRAAFREAAHGLFKD